MKPRTQRSGHLPNRRERTALRIFLWALSPLDERLQGLSLTRLLAVACFVYVAHTIWEEQRLSWVDYNVMVLGVCTAFGKKLVYALVTRQAQKHKDTPEEGP